MLQRIKNWLIKKMGGYTKEEYADWSRIPILRCAPFKVEQKGAVTLRQRVPVYMDFLPRETEYEFLRAKARAIDALREAIIPYIICRTVEDPFGYQYFVEVELQVVKNGIE